MPVRSVAFYTLLLVPVLAWAAIVLPNILFPSGVDFSAAIVRAAVVLSPVIGGDLSIFGEVTPIILGGLIIACMPKSEKINFVAIGLALLSYVFFLHLSVFFSSGPGVGLLSANFFPIAEAQKIILALVSNVRMMAIVVAASILGFKFKA